jgi:hypothetical protein
MHYNDHVPPHFHAWYGSDRATICIRDMAVPEGHPPPRVLGLVVEWAAQHSDVMPSWVLKGDVLVQVISPVWGHDQTRKTFCAVAKSALPKL